MQFDDVGVGELGKVFDFANGVHGYAVLEFCIELDLLYGDKATRVIAVVSCIHDGVCSFSELLALHELILDFLVHLRCQVLSAFVRCVCGKVVRGKSGCCCCGCW